MVKQAVTQRSFVHGEPREGFLEAKDLEIRSASCRKALNVRVTATRSLDARPGTLGKIFGSAADNITELRPATGQVFGLMVENTRLVIVDRNGFEIRAFSVVPWTDASKVWVEPFRDKTILGGEFGLFFLDYNNGVWIFGTFVFSAAASGEIAQPYWSFQDDIEIRPSARSGNGITITASAPIWNAKYVGLRVRYGGREIRITSITSSTVANGNVISSLPPSFRLTVASGDNYRAGDAVIGQDTNFQGLVISRSGNVLSVVTTAFLDGPDVGEKLSGPSVTSEVTAKVEIAPLMSPIWDEPLMSAARGYPRAGASASGRLTLVDFPQVPDLVVMSSSRSIEDFDVGAEDDDAIARQCGDNAPRFLHAVNAGDLLLFSEQGIYVVNLRDSGILSPSTFNAFLVDRRGANAVRPAQIDAGVTFVEASGDAVAVALLDANRAYASWAVRTITTLHSHLIKTPVKLCGPSTFSTLPEKYMFIVNSDGTVAAMSWSVNFDIETLGFVPWETQGKYVSFSPIFGTYWCIVDRLISGVTTRCVEELDPDQFVDCAVPAIGAANIEVNGVALTVNGVNLTTSAPLPTPFIGATVSLVAGSWDLGDFVADGAGSIAGADVPGAFAGFNFEARVSPWAVELIESPRHGLLKARVIQGAVSVQNTGLFKIRANRNTKRVGGYQFGDDLDAAPPLFTGLHRFLVMGVRDHPEIEFIKDRPQPFSVLAVTQEVQA